MADLMLLLILILLIGLTGLNVQASEDKAQPSPELLEFLGEWETDNGEWFNPLWILKNIQSTTKDNKATEKEPKND